MKVELAVLGFVPESPYGLCGRNATFEEYGHCLTPLLPQHFNFPGSKVLRSTPANSIFDGPVTTLLLMLYVLVEVLSRASAKRGKGLTHLEFGTSVGRCLSDGAPSR